MVTCSAPGKIYLFGEHAVVYGEGAICCAVDIRTSVSAQLHDSVVIESTLGKTGMDFKTHPYVSAIIERMREITDIDGVSIKIDSDIPVGSGLGSSAAVTVATIKALDHLFDCKLSFADIAGMGHDVEKQVQGAASPTDTYVSTMGGVFQISKRRKLEPIKCGIVVGNTNKDSPTGELVAGVSELKDAYPDIISPIISLIGKMSDTGEELVNSADYTSIGELMNVNQGLLDAIGVGGPELSSLVYSARSAGAYGAKITGAGGGGCMVALTDVSRVRDVADAITAAGGDAIVTRVTEQGVKLEPGI